jgi:hypothetical protein
MRSLTDLPSLTPEEVQDGWCYLTDIEGATKIAAILDNNSNLEDKKFEQAEQEEMWRRRAETDKEELDLTKKAAMQKVMDRAMPMSQKFNSKFQTLLTTIGLGPKKKKKSSKNSGAAAIKLNIDKQKQMEADVAALKAAQQFRDDKAAARGMENEYKLKLRDEMWALSDAAMAIVRDGEKLLEYMPIDLELLEAVRLTKIERDERRARRINAEAAKEKKQARERWMSIPWDQRIRITAVKRWVGFKKMVAATWGLIKRMYKKLQAFKKSLKPRWQTINYSTINVAPQGEEKPKQTADRKHPPFNQVRILVHSLSQ